MTEEKKSTYRNISFRPTPAVEKLLDTVDEILDCNRSELINECLEGHLASVIDERITVRAKAIEEFRKLQSRPTPTQTAQRMAKKASADIKKKRKK